MFAITDSSTIDIYTYLAEHQTQIVAEVMAPPSWDPLPQNGVLDIPEIVISINTPIVRTLSQREQEIMHDSLLASVEIVE